jgi:hypothetical protein
MTRQGRLKLAREMHSSFGTGRRVLEQEKQVTNWKSSGGHVRAHTSRMPSVKSRAVIARVAGKSC